MGLVTGDQSGYGLFVAGANSELPKAQDGKEVVDHFKKEMVKRYGKYLITDKGTNRMYYGYPGADSKMVENNFEVLTGKSGNTDYVSPYSLEETEKKSKAVQDKIRVTPVGRFPVSYNADIYGNPGLNLDNSGGLAAHTTYDPAVRNAYYNNNNPNDNYASYGCINCRKPDINAVLKGFGNKDFMQIVDSRKSVDDNLALGRDNNYLYNHPEAAKMLFEMPGAQFVRRTWNPQQGVYEGTNSDFNPYTETIVSKKELAPVTVVGRRKSKVLPQEEQAAAPVRGKEGVPDAQQYASVVDYLNQYGIDSSKANRMRIAHEMGLNDYNFQANDNQELLRLLQEKAAGRDKGNVAALRQGGTVWHSGLPKAQDGREVVDHFKQEMLKQYGKYLITDKGTNRMYYGYPGPDGKMVENNFEVLTGKSGNTDYISPYSLEETERKSQAFQNKIRVTPVGRFPISYNADIYGNPGLNIDNSGGLAAHTTYDPAVRDAYYNNQNPKDNYASYGCINCRKPDINAVLKGFGAKDFMEIIDSRKSVTDNLALGQDNKYLYNNPAAARMLFEMPGSQFVRRTWNPLKGVYEGADSDFNPTTETIISKKELAPVTVYGRRKSKVFPQEQEKAAPEVKKAPGETMTPLQQEVAPASQQYVSIVDYLNERGIDSSKANRIKMAHEMGIDDYNFRANDNLELLRLFQEKAAAETNDKKKMREGGGIPPHSFDGGSLQQSLKPVDRSLANIEAERGETVIGDFDQDGTIEQLSVGGQRHAEGGTPLLVPPGAFVFSDTQKMRIGGSVLQEFGKSAATKKKYTPAQLSRQYPLNKYKALMGDPDADKLQLNTAQLMIQNNQRKLAKLALLQEGKKGFPNGIPNIALPLVQEAMQSQQPAMSGQQPAAGNLLQGSGNQESEVSDQLLAENQEQLAAEQQMRYGGLIKADRGYSFPIDPYKGDKANPRKDQQQQNLTRGFNKFSAPWLTDYGYDNTVSGLNQALKAVGYTGDANDNKAVQQFLVQENLNKGNYQLFNDLLSRYRMTNQGIRAGLPSGVDALPADLAAKKDDPQTRTMLEKAFVDGLFGVRSGEMLQSLLPDPYAPDLRPLPFKMPLAKIGERGTIDAKVVPQTMTVRPPLDWKKAGKERMPWFLQDKINTGAAIHDRYNLKKYMPTYVGTDVVLPNATFFDPTRQLAANQEAANSQNMMSAMYSGPQRLRAVGSNIQGQGATNAANILAQVQNQNVGVANQFAGIRSEILNNQALRNAIAKKTYLDEVTTVNQQYDNSVAAANQNVRNNLVSGISNARQAYLVNKFNPQFRFDPGTGRMAFTDGRKDFFSGARGSSAASGAGSGKPALATYKEIYDEFIKNMNNPDKAHEFAQKMTFGTKSRFDADSDGDMQVSTSGYANPSTMGMLQMLAPQYGR